MRQQILDRIVNGAGPVQGRILISANLSNRSCVKAFQSRKVDE